MYIMVSHIGHSPKPPNSSYSFAGWIVMGMSWPMNWLSHLKMSPYVSEDTVNSLPRRMKNLSSWRKVDVLPVSSVIVTSPAHSPCQNMYDCFCIRDGEYHLLVRCRLRRSHIWAAMQPGLSRYASMQR
jgi:hypothetical protein